MNKLLFKELEDLSSQIATLSPDSVATVDELVLAIRRDMPDFPDPARHTIEDHARLMLQAITEIPDLVKHLKILIARPDCSSEMKHALVLALVYLVRCDDMISDELGGGLGYVDDYIVLRTSLARLLSDADFMSWYAQSSISSDTNFNLMHQKLSDWVKATPDAIARLTQGMPKSRLDMLSTLEMQISNVFQDCKKLAGKPEWLSRRTQQLIEDPHLPDSVLTATVEDDAVWKQWEAEQAERRRTSG